MGKTMNDTDELRAAAQQALVALVHHTEQTRPIQRTADAIEALRAALAHLRPPGERAGHLGVEVEQGGAPAAADLSTPGYAGRS